jgi:hypothetical protein
VCCVLDLFHSNALQRNGSQPLHLMFRAREGCWTFEVEMEVVVVERVGDV